MRLLYSRQLEHFLAVYEAGSLRKAAEQSGVTQPGLSKSLRLLESALSMTLFERRPSGMVPTAAADLLWRHGQHIISSGRYLEAEMAMLRAGEAGSLRIGSGMAWSATRMPHLLSQLHTRFPRLEITMQTGISDQLTPRLLAGQLDVVFASLPANPLPPGFVTVPLPHAQMAAFSRADHPLTRRRNLTLQELAQWPLAGFAEDLDWEWHVQGMFRAAGLASPPTILRSSSLATLLATVAAGDSLTILSELLSENAQAAGLKRLRLADPLWRIHMGISYRAQGAELAPLKELLRLATGV